MYYFFDKQRRRRGPFSAEDVRRMMAEGIVNGHTLVLLPDGTVCTLSKVNLGEAGVLPLPSAPARKTNGPKRLKLEKTASPFTPAKTATSHAECPHCGRTLDGASIPPVCPHCDAHLHPGSESIWENALYAFERYACFRGRARRKEYWSFTLISFLAQVVLGVAVAALAALKNGNSGAGQVAFEQVLSNPILHGIAFLFLFLPTLAVTVRRLHDRGHSGWCILANWIFVILGILALWYNIQYAIAWNPLPILLWAAAACINIYISVQMVLPSKPGWNKYGPSVLFPRG